MYNQRPIDVLEDKKISSKALRKKKKRFCIERNSNDDGPHFAELNKRPGLILFYSLSFLHRKLTCRAFGSKETTLGDARGLFRLCPPCSAAWKTLGGTAKRIRSAPSATDAIEFS